MQKNLHISTFFNFKWFWNTKRYRFMFKICHANKRSVYIIMLTDCPKTECLRRALIAGRGITITRMMKQTYRKD